MLFSDKEDETVVGTCQLMCPEEERFTRERQRRLHIFEIQGATEGTGRPQADPHAIVKEYTRCAAGKEIRLQELRPANVLQITMNYLIDNVADRDDEPWHVVYSFMSDRIRAIRQDMVIQRISGPAAIDLLEKAIRFYILAGYRLCESSFDVFDPKLNNDHIQECLKRLLVLYENEEHNSCCNRVEFETYYLLCNLRSYDAQHHFLTLPSYALHNSSLQLAFEINKSAMQGNFVRFFRQVKSLPFLASCAVHKWFRQVQMEALEVMNTAFSSRILKFSISDFAKSLGFNSTQEAEQFCTFYGVKATGDMIYFLKGSFVKKEKLFPPKKMGYKCPGSLSKLLHTCSVTDPNWQHGKDHKLQSGGVTCGTTTRGWGVGRGWIGRNKRSPYLQIQIDRAMK